MGHQFFGHFLVKSWSSFYCVWLCFTVFLLWEAMHQVYLHQSQMSQVRLAEAEAERATLEQQLAAMKGDVQGRLLLQAKVTDVTDITDVAVYVACGRNRRLGLQQQLSLNDQIAWILPS